MTSLFDQAGMALRKREPNGARSVPLHWAAQLLGIDRSALEALLRAGAVTLRSAQTETCGITSPAARLGLLLGGIAARMHGERERERTMPFALKQSLTIEHVAPQNWDRHWRKAKLNFGNSEEDKIRLDQLVHLHWAT